MLSKTPAAPIADQTMNTATQVTMPKAIESRKAVFITDHGSIRDIRSRALRVWPLAAALVSPNSTLSVSSDLPATALALSMTACRAALTLSPNDSGLPPNLPGLSVVRPVTPYDDSPSDGLAVVGLPPAGVVG